MPAILSEALLSSPARLNPSLSALAIARWNTWKRLFWEVREGLVTLSLISQCLVCGWLGASWSHSLYCFATSHCPAICLLSCVLQCSSLSRSLRTTFPGPLSLWFFSTVFSIVELHPSLMMLHYAIASPCSVLQLFIFLPWPFSSQLVHRAQQSSVSCLLAPFVFSWEFLICGWSAAL